MAIIAGIINRDTAKKVLFLIEIGSLKLTTNNIKKRISQKKFRFLTGIKKLNKIEILPIKNKANTG